MLLEILFNFFFLLIVRWQGFAFMRLMTALSAGQLLCSDRQQVELD